MNLTRKFLQSQGFEVTVTKGGWIAINGNVVVERVRRPFKAWRIAVNKDVPAKRTLIQLPRITLEKFKVLRTILNITYTTKASI